MVVRTRQLWNKTTHQVQFYLTSLESDAPTVARARLHWGIQLHWTLDVTFAEDASRVRTGHAPLDASRSIVSIASYPSNAARQKSNRAAMDNDYMLKVLAACLQSNLDAEPTCQ